MSEAVSLLHNMSAPPRSVVKYAGLTAEAPIRMKTGLGDVFGTAVAFHLPSNLWRMGAKALLDVIGEGGGEGSPETRAPYRDLWRC